MTDQGIVERIACRPRPRLFVELKGDFWGIGLFSTDVDLSTHTEGYAPMYLWESEILDWIGPIPYTPITGAQLLEVTHLFDDLVNSA